MAQVPKYTTDFYEVLPLYALDGSAALPEVSVARLEEDGTPRLEEDGTPRVTEGT